MSQYTIYHNPRCSKSRATLQLLEAHQADTAVVKYLETPPSLEQLKAIIKALDTPVRNILRTGEAEYKDNGFANPELSDEQLLVLLQQHPKVLERPIVMHQGRAVIGRPPENVLSLLP
jgi:arsenate reductase